MSKKVKVLMGIPPKQLMRGGPTTHLPLLVKVLEQSTVYSIRTFDYGSKRGAETVNGKKENLLAKVANTVRVFCLFVYEIISYRPQVVHINTAFDKNSLLRDIPFSIFCFLLNKKLLFKIHGSSNLVNTNSKVYLLLVKLFFLGATRVGVLSGVERDQFVSRFGNNAKLIVVKNIVIEREPESQSMIVKDSQKIYAVFVSRIIEGKGLKDLIEAMPAILHLNPNFVLVVAGDGPELSICQRLANELQISDSIVWIGFVSNNEIPLVLNGADIFLFPSHFPEGMPMALMEALRCGLPIITTKVRFAINYLAEGTNCLFIERGNIPDISSKISALIANESMREAMRRANPLMVKRFSSSIVGLEFEEIYSQMLSVKLSPTNKNDTVRSLP